MGETIDDVHTKANCALNCICEYMLANQLHINIAKSCYMHFQPIRSEGFGLDKLFSENKLEIMGIPIKSVNSTRCSFLSRCSYRQRTILASSNPKTNLKTKLPNRCYY